MNTDFTTEKSYARHAEEFQVSRGYSVSLILLLEIVASRMWQMWLLP